MRNPDFDVLIVGAGLSGIGAAYHLQEKCPGKSFAILEGRDAIGGTWDIFRYPGIRSDSDMHTLGYNFKPWEERKAIADGPAILKYVRETAEENGIDKRIRFNHLVRKASWDSPSATWTVEAEDAKSGETHTLTCRFLYMCAGYYSYEGGYKPDFPGEETFRGEIVHPQKWPEDLDYKDKKVVVIGSGATAVTLVPEMAKDAAHVTMLQRSPTYVVSRPAEDRLAIKLRKLLPSKMAYGLTRWRNVLFQMFFYNMARKRPEKVKERIIGLARQELGPEFDVDTHFTPRYNPWDQRLCLVPDSDLFASLKEGSSSVVTDHIETFTESGIQLKSGATLDADIIVTATGLQLVFLGGMDVEIDGAPLVPSQTHGYRGIMFEGVPNLASTFGYTNASWTLKADLTADFVTRLLKFMDRKGYSEVRPVAEGEVGDEPWLDFSSGYVTRVMEQFPKQGTETPWRLHQNYLKDIFLLRHANLEDGVLQFRTSERAKSPRSVESSDAVAAE
ncbi:MULTISPECIES: flavin-containing monooxygenase [Henriciella]|jgi:cation diffusion facilitator CzcD-associated flavoprotein CzcO|uniref:Cyclohexanone monooxygenase n=1 Tax=Henriciella pelagia TaxID=1977912 RepID=A0ABQ1J0L8_9PROT|nr:NAD(P)/FAD-dependent oxidoreductase [Henriciella pelagia]GGB55948.1 cyclohexanone monooxygenase [Henriciella pelagia]